MVTVLPQGAREARTLTGCLTHSRVNPVENLKPTSRPSLKAPRPQAQRSFYAIHI
jgi:hypothetical protein